MRPKNYPYSKNKTEKLPFGYQKPFQTVINTKDGVYIDNKRINYVEEDGVKIKDLGGGLHRITISLITDDYKTK